MSKKMEYGSDVIAEILRQQGIEYVTYNPGSTITNIYDSLMHFDDRGMPKPILCCHEEIAIAIAHGYGKVTGKAMAVLLHSNVGLQHASMAIFNAWCDRVPLLIIGGIGPMDSEKRRPWIDWIHTSHSQTSIINDYVKWHDEPYSLAAAEESLQRAFYLTNTEPKAPTYVSMDVSIQESLIENNAYRFRTKFHTKAKPSQADPETIKEIAYGLLKACFPIVIVDYMGKNKLSVNNLIQLAEYLDIAVLDCGGRYNFPNAHELCMTGQEEAILKKSDYILALDVQDLQGFFDTHNYTKQNKLVHVTLSDYLLSSWSSEYQKFCSEAEYVYADSAFFLKELILWFETNNKSIVDSSERKKYLSMLHNKQKKLWIKEATPKFDSNLITMPALLYQIWDSIKHENWSLVGFGSILIGQWARKLWEFKKPDSYFGFSGGAGLGYGLGAAIGASLALSKKDIICINLQTDGDLLFTPSALWTMAHYNVPVLNIVFNNKSYGNTKGHSRRTALLRKRDVDKDSGSDIYDPVVNYPILARSFGIKSFNTINDLKNIRPTLDKAISYIKTNKKPVLIDIIFE